MKYLALILITLIFMTGCGSAPVRAHGGHTSHTTVDGAKVELQQPENPKDVSKQDLCVDDESSVIVPAGSTLKETVVQEVAGKPTTNQLVYTVQTNTTVFHKHHENSTAKVGASQLDLVGDTIAKLNSTKWWSVLGFVIFVGGIFLAFWPASQAFMGGALPGIGIAVAGLVIAALPILLVGHETFILVGVSIAGAVAVAMWYAHHHGGLVAELNVLKTKIESKI